MGVIDPLIDGAAGPYHTKPSASNLECMPPRALLRLTRATVNGLTTMLFLLLGVPRPIGRCGVGLKPFVGFPFRRFGLDVWGWMEDGGLEEAYSEFNVEEDLALGNKWLEPWGDLSTLEFVFFLRRSLKNGIGIILDGTRYLARAPFLSGGIVRF